VTVIQGGGNLAAVDPDRNGYDLDRVREILGFDISSSKNRAASLPFSLRDTTAGAENELQAVVIGRREDVDFPQVIEASNYFRNVRKRMAAGEISRNAVSDLESFLNHNPEGVWENSWVRFPATVLNEYAKTVFERDLLADKTRAEVGRRQDAGCFFVTVNGREQIRTPVSYLLKLSLAGVLGEDPRPHPLIRRTGERLLDHFLNDNSSPETFSFCPVDLKPGNGMGRRLARESLKRFLLCQLLIRYANRRFGLEESGQRAEVYSAPHPPLRQRRLNDLIPDGFYRKLFMSPCLSGWNRGEVKQEYMHLCHMVLSRSQLNGVAKLREAGIVSRNLVVLPNTSNTSLANNGVHISIGSRKLTELLKDPESGFTARDEKHLGDLAIKIAEHFLPLFVGTYSAAPYRLDFQDFHPEKVLGYLPHELDFTHLRMLWRRWKKKARLRFFGHPITPLGPVWLDRRLSRLLGLKGDYVPDFRLLDYLVALMSTVESPALDGCCDSDQRLKKDLAELGVFDAGMPLYLLYRLRRCADMGYSGFEARYYSLFEDVETDMGDAASLQTLITALAWQYILTGAVSHAHIPDTPFVESERRQVFFGAAIDIPTFFVHSRTPNLFMRKILRRTDRSRPSRRYKGYIRVHQTEYRRALVRLLREEGADLIAMMNLGDTLQGLKQRIEDPRSTAVGRLTRGILREADAPSPLALSAETFNSAAERYYRETLRRRHTAAAFDLLEEDFQVLHSYAILGREDFREALVSVLGTAAPADFFDNVRRAVSRDTATAGDLFRLIRLVLLSVSVDLHRCEGGRERTT
jgi:hypothetical protein